MSKFIKIFIVFSVLVIVALCSVSIYFAWAVFDGNPNNKLVHNFFNEDGYVKPELDTTPKVPTPEKSDSDIQGSDITGLSTLGTTYSTQEINKRINILVLGVDARGNHLGGRSDAILLLSIDEKQNRLDLVSIPRDSYVEIGDTGKYDKINHAYAYGGIDEAKLTVENLFGIKIDHYVVFNFSSFVNLVDVVGGIEIDVPFAFSEQDSRDRRNAIHLKSGLQTLNGEEALAYARMRKSDPKGDIGRGSRQQEVVLAVMDKLLDISSLPKLIDIYKTIQKSIATDVSVTDLPDFYSYLKKYSSVNSHIMTGSGVMIDGVYYYKLDSSRVKEIQSILG